MAAKLAAGRPKDFDFVGALLRHGIVNPVTARERVALLPVDRTIIDRLVAWIDGQAVDPGSA